MAVDISTVCELASENQSSQTLAVVLSVLFSVYTAISIALSALTIYTSSRLGTPVTRDPIRQGEELALITNLQSSQVRA